MGDRSLFLDGDDRTDGIADPTVRGQALSSAPERAPALRAHDRFGDESCIVTCQIKRDAAVVFHGPTVCSIMSCNCPPSVTLTGTRTSCSPRSRAAASPASSSLSAMMTDAPCPQNDRECPNRPPGRARDDRDSLLQLHAGPRRGDIHDGLGSQAGVDQPPK